MNIIEISSVPNVQNIANFLKTWESMLIPIITSFIAFGGVAITVIFTSKDIKDKQKTELLINAKMEVLKERIKYLKEIQGLMVTLSSSFLKVRKGREAYSRRISVQINLNADEIDEFAAKDDFDEVMAQFRIDSTSLLSKLNPEVDESKPEVIIEKTLRDYEELCFRYVAKLSAVNNGEIYEETHSNKEISLVIEDFDKLENQIINSIRQIAKETWSQAKNEFII